VVEANKLCKANDALAIFQVFAGDGSPVEAVAMEDKGGEYVGTSAELHCTHPLVERGKGLVE
jgi:hypothetical protein